MARSLWFWAESLAMVGVRHSIPPMLPPAQVDHGGSLDDGTAAHVHGMLVALRATGGSMEEVARQIIHEDPSMEAAVAQAILMDVDIPMQARLAILNDVMRIASLSKALRTVQQAMETLGDAGLSVGVSASGDGPWDASPQADAIRAILSTRRDAVRSVFEAHGIAPESMVALAGPDERRDMAGGLVDFSRPSFSDAKLEGWIRPHGETSETPSEIQLNGLFGRMNEAQVWRVEKADGQDRLPFGVLPTAGGVGVFYTNGRIPDRLHVPILRVQAPEGFPIWSGSPIGGDVNQGAGMCMACVVSAYRATRLKHLGSGIHVSPRGAVDIEDCDHLTILMPTAPDVHYIRVKDCAQLHTISGIGVVRGAFLADDCPKLVTLPDGMVLAPTAEALGVHAHRGGIHIRGCDSFTAFPNDLKLSGGTLAVERCPAWDGIIPPGVDDTCVVRWDGFPKENLSTKAFRERMAIEGPWLKH